MCLFFKRIPFFFFILCLTCLAPALSWAQGQPQPTELTSVIPYQGTLFSQGKPVSQTNLIKMAFAIYSDNTGLEAGARADAPALNRTWTSWTSPEGEDDAVNADKTIGVQVRNGRFLVHLGEEEYGQQPLKDSTFTPDPPTEYFYVVTWVVKDSGGVFRLPPQKLGKVPHAVTAERAHGFEVHGVLKVNEIEPLSHSSLQLNGSLHVNGQVTSNDSHPMGIHRDYGCTEPFAFIKLSQRDDVDMGYCARYMYAGADPRRTSFHNFQSCIDAGGRVANIFEILLMIHRNNDTFRVITGQEGEWRSYANGSSDLHHNEYRSTRSGVNGQEVNPDVLCTNNRDVSCTEGDIYWDYWDRLDDIGETGHVLCVK